MTIIEPHKNHFSSYQEFLYIGVLLFLTALLSIYFYSLNVNLKFQISLQEKAVQKLESLNGDLRDKLHQALNTKNLSEFIKSQNLVADKNPNYFEDQSLAVR